MALFSTGLASRVLAGERLVDIMANGCIELRSGPVPSAGPDDAASGQLLGYITRDGLPWTPGAPTGGLVWENSGRYVQKRTGHTWMLRGVASGVLGHFRVVANSPDDGDLSVSAPRIDGVIAVTNTVYADLYVPTLDITPTTLRKVDLFWLTLS